MNGTGVATYSFYDEWAWAIFVIVGLLMVVLELVIGVEAGFDIALVGSVLIIAGLVTWPVHIWWVTVIVAIVLGTIYMTLLRSYVRKRTRIKGIKTNIDAIIGKSGQVIRPISASEIGLVKIGSEEWRASAVEDIPEGDEIVVTGLSGITLQVKKREA
jgi:membrane protein implicated in regulation of membrane protease activity